MHSRIATIDDLEFEILELSEAQGDENLPCMPNQRSALHDDGGLTAGAVKSCCVLKTHWGTIQNWLTSRSAAAQPIGYFVLGTCCRLRTLPAQRRGNHLASVLAALRSLGYAVEWRTVRMSSRQHQTFFVAYHQSTRLHNRLSGRSLVSPRGLLVSDGVIPKAIPVRAVHCDMIESFTLGHGFADADYEYAPGARGASRFANAGYSWGHVWTAEVRGDEAQ